MKLNNIHISNFRCFKDYEVEFSPGVTILFGKNGAGKSTLINAIHKALSFIMYSDIIRKKNKGAKKSKVVDIKTITSGNPYLHVESFAKDDYNEAEANLMEIQAQAELSDDKKLDWSMSAFTTNAKIRTTTFSQAFNEFYNWHKETDELPLLAFYSDGFPHAEDNKKQSIKEKIASLRNFGYFDWNEKEACTKEWLERIELDLKNIYRVRQRLEKYAEENDPLKKLTEQAIAEERNVLEKCEAEINAVEDCFARFSNCLEDDNYKVAALVLGTDKGEDEKLYFKTIQGPELSYRKLPAGYKRLFSIVLDLAIRSYILSGSVDAKGIVLIDEIDLHLHPELERLVLPAFMQTFPNLQIILSTHSPLVLTGLKTEGKENKIINMRSGDEKATPLHDIYGLDYNTSLEDVMGVESKNSDLDYMISLCAYMKSKGANENALEIRNDIIEKYSKNETELDKLIDAKLKELN